jgi:hypothetical protein
MTVIQFAHKLFRERRSDDSHRIHAIDTGEGVFVTSCDANDDLHTEVIPRSSYRDDMAMRSRLYKDAMTRIKAHQ